MKVSDKKGSVGGVNKAGHADAAQKASKAASSSQSSGVQKSGVSVSSDGAIASTLAGDAAQRADRVSQIKMDVLSGNYEADSTKTAEKLLQNLTDYSLA